MRLTVGDYPRMDARTPPVGVPDDSWTLWRWNAVAGAKFWAVSSALKAMGQSLLASKIWDGWQVLFRLPLHLTALRILKLSITV